MSAVMRAMVLAAGRGSRLAPLTDVCPKPLLQVGSCTLLERALQGLEVAGFEQIVVNHSWLGGQIVQALEGRPGAQLQLSNEEEQRLETGGGICQALPHLGEGPFAVLNADVLSDYPLQRLAEKIRHWPAGQLAHLVLVPNPEHNPQGDFSVVSGRLQNRPQATFSGLSVLHPALFEGSEAGAVFPLAPLLRRAAERGLASAELYSGYWNDVGTPERLQAARDWALNPQV